MAGVRASVSEVSASFVMSTWTGPGRPDFAMWKASAMTRGMSSAVRTRKLCFVIGSVMPVMSISWKASLPMSAPGTLPVIATIGMLSSCAVAMPVTRFVAPGPEVPRQTPTLPLARA